MQQVNRSLIDIYGGPPWLQKVFPKKAKVDKMPSEILLGFGGEVRGNEVIYDYTDPVTINIPKKSSNFPNIMMATTKGAGKTAIAINIASQLYNSGFKTFIVDPKGTLGKIKDPALARFHKILEMSKLEPKGVNARVILPSFLKTNPKYKRTDEIFEVTLDDFYRIPDYSQRLELLYKFFRIEDKIDRTSQELCKSVENMKPVDFTDFLNKLGVLKGRAQVLYRNLKNTIDLEIVKDMGGINIAEIMEEQLVVMQCALSRYESYSPCYVTFALNQITSWQEKSKKRPVCCVLDEVDVLAPNDINMPSKQPVRDLVTKYREMGIMCVFITQNPNLVDEPTTQQVDYILTTKVPGNSGVAKYLHGRQISTDQLYKLYYGAPDFYPKEWKIITWEEQRNFFPIPPMCKC
jgi:hypothetical protein